MFRVLSFLRSFYFILFIWILLNLSVTGLENEDMTPTLRQLWTSIKQLQQDMTQMKIQINEERALRGNLQQLLMNHLESVGTSNTTC